MAEPFAIADIRAALLERAVPDRDASGTGSRGGRARSGFDRALRAEVRDALWMLTRQWQLGEFRGDDAGSPVSAKMRIDRTRLTQYRARRRRPPSRSTTSVPLEATVERRPLPLDARRARAWRSTCGCAGPPVAAS